MVWGDDDERTWYSASASFHESTRAESSQIWSCIGVPVSRSIIDVEFKAGWFGEVVFVRGESTMWLLGGNLPRYSVVPGTGSHGEVGDHVNPFAPHFSWTQSQISLLIWSLIHTFHVDFRDNHSIQYL